MELGGGRMERRKNGSLGRIIKIEQNEIVIKENEIYGSQAV